MFRVLKEEPEFRRLWTGQAISQAGDALYFLLFLFMVERLTNNPAMVGYVGAIQALPFLVFSPIAGTLADRVDRRKLMLGSDVASTVILAAFAAVLWVDPTPPVWTIFLTAGLLSTVHVVFLPAKSASIPRLVRNENLNEANALSAATSSIVFMGGIAFSATVLGTIEKAFPDIFFLAAVCINCSTFAASAWFLRGLPPLLPRADEATDRHPLQDLTDGFRYMRTQPALRTALVVILVLQLFISPFMVVHIAVNETWFDGRYATLAKFEMAFLLGMMIFSLVVGKMNIRRAGLAFSFAILFVGLLVAAMAVSRDFYAYLLLNFLCGVALPFGDLPLVAYRQRVVEDAFQGRVQSLFVMIPAVVQPVANAAAGMLLKAWGPETMFYTMGFGMAGGALIGFASQSFRKALVPHAQPTRTPATLEGEPAHENV